MIIPIFQNTKRINLKKAKGNENPFKIFQDLDRIFESFLDGFAEGVEEDFKKSPNIQNDLIQGLHKIEDLIKDDNVVVTNVRDITKEVKE